jgi:hypothetical protein
MPWIGSGHRRHRSPGLAIGAVGTRHTGLRLPGGSFSATIPRTASVPGEDAHVSVRELISYHGHPPSQMKADTTARHDGGKHILRRKPSQQDDNWTTCHLDVRRTPSHAAAGTRHGGQRPRSFVEATGKSVPAIAKGGSIQGCGRYMKAYRVTPCSGGSHDPNRHGT